MLKLNPVIILLATTSLALGCAQSVDKSSTDASATPETPPVGESSATAPEPVGLAAAATSPTPTPAMAEQDDVLKREAVNVAPVRDDAPEPAYLSREYIEVRTPRGAVQPFVLHTVANAKANIILLRGGSGYVDLAKTKSSGRGNFAVRTRGLFASAGYNTVVAYLPTDRDFAYRWRASKGHADDLGAIIDFVASQNDLPIWVLGTSYSGASATNAAARSTSGELTGIVLAAATLYDDPDEPKWREEAERLREKYGSEYANMNIRVANSAAVSTKVVLLHNQADKCPTSRLAADSDARALLPNADLKIVHVNGGSAKGNKNWKIAICGGGSEHGFFKIENEAVSAIDGAIGSFN